ncbi:MAG TPA: zinc ribbon domain-containing protein [Candidatus Binataceae bacterium]|nr:zinc ribbon domain-containing protein [Candidatus Binataceae bacterium]
MPIYEYHCADCDRSFESFVRPGGRETQCPGCHGENIARELSVFASGRGADAAGPLNGGGGGNGGGAMSGGGCCGGGCGCR